MAGPLLIDEKFATVLHKPISEKSKRFWNTQTPLSKHTVASALFGQWFFGKRL
jgi:hypothetical protein